MVITGRTESGTAFECTSPGCGRRLVLHTGGGRTVVQAGDERATHRGGLAVVVGSSAG